MDKQTMEFLNKNLKDAQKLQLLMDSEFMESDDVIYSMDDFDDVMGNQEPLRLAYMIYYGEFLPTHDYFYFDGRGNLNSLEDVADAIDEMWYPELLEEREDILEDYDFVQELLEERD